MIRILHIVTQMTRGGLETLIMNCYRHIDREQIQFDFLVHRSYRADYDDEIEALGGKIYRLPRLNPFHPGYYKALFTFFCSHPEYRIVHCHLDCMSAIPLSAAKKCGVPVRIAHGHNTNQDKDWKYPLKLFFMRFIPKVATDFFSCSRDAGNWMFPGCPFTVISNGIESTRFKYAPDVRNSVRSELDIENLLVIGHTGRFMPQKNHSFLIDIFLELHRIQPNSVLLLVGDGPLRKEIEQKAARHGLSDSVLFLGVREDVDRILQAMDVFIMPSLYEGFGIVALEAQTSGLPCFISDVIPRDCIVTDLVTQLPLSMSASEWASEIARKLNQPRTDHSKEVAASGFDISDTAKWLESFYLKIGD